MNYRPPCDVHSIALDRDLATAPASFSYLHSEKASTPLCCICTWDRTVIPSKTQKTLDRKLVLAFYCNKILHGMCRPGLGRPSPTVSRSFPTDRHRYSRVAFRQSGPMAKTAELRGPARESLSQQPGTVRAYHSSLAFLLARGGWSRVISTSWHSLIVCRKRSIASRLGDVDKLVRWGSGSDVAVALNE